MIVHNFHDSLAASHGATDLLIWEEIYRNAFDDFAGMVDHRCDGAHQRAGIDRSVVLENSKQLLIDEKVRFRPYRDIALEVWSDEARGTPGWVQKPLLADYIAYAVAPLGIGYLLPVPQLQGAWRRYGDQWLADYRRIEAYNEHGARAWVTVSVPVPVPELFSRIGECLRVRFTPVVR